MGYPNEDEGPDEVTWPAEKAQHTPLPWSIRPNKFDDWGFIRGADGQTLACVARGQEEKEFDWHRSHGTDPYQANADLIVHSVNAVPGLIVALEEIAATDQYPDHEDSAAELREIARAALAKVKQP